MTQRPKITILKERYPDRSKKEWTGSSSDVYLDQLQLNMYNMNQNEKMDLHSKMLFPKVTFFTTFLQMWTLRLLGHNFFTWDTDAISSTFSGLDCNPSMSPTFFSVFLKSIFQKKCIKGMYNIVTNSALKSQPSWTRANSLSYEESYVETQTQ